MFVKGCADDQQYSRRQGQPDFRFARKIRRLRLQQIPRRRLCHRRLSDRLSEGQLSRRIFQRHDDQRHERHGKAGRNTSPRRAQFGIEVLPPDVNESGVFFAPGARRARPSVSAWPPSKASAKSRSKHSGGAQRERKIQVAVRIVRARGWPHRQPQDAGSA